MKRAIYIIIFLFLLTSLLSINNELPNDGYLEIGFPLIFLKLSNAKIDDNLTGFSALFLLIDLGVIAVISLLIHYFLLKKRNRKMP